MSELQWPTLIGPWATIWARSSRGRREYPWRILSREALLTRQLLRSVLMRLLLTTVLIFYVWRV